MTSDEYCYPMNIMTKKFIYTMGFLITLLTLVSCQKDKKAIRIIPEPVSVKTQVGRFHFTGIISMETNSPELDWCKAYLVAKIGKAAGVEWVDRQLSGGKKIKLVLEKDADKLLGEEGYHLVVNPRNIQIRARSPQGVFYAIQSLLQLMDPVVYSAEGTGDTNLVIPCAEIIDYPRFPWRGFMLDVSRHFLDKEYMYQVIDYLALHKLNTLHWHLVDDQGWRIEIKQYPKLTEVGAWRTDREHLHWNARGGALSPDEEAGKLYGGFYTQDEIRDIVQYAADRFVTIVPEIEMPAHVMAAISSYPYLSCNGLPIAVPSGGVWPITDILCAGKESTFQFLEIVLTEVMDLFPSQYIHIGGDEATKTNWTTCPDCQKRIQSEGLQSVEELQSYFIQRIEKFLHEHGRNLIGWDEILEGGLAPNAAVMSWRGIQGGIEAANAGHPVVMSPTSFCYFDYYQGDPELEPLAIGGFLPLEKVYSFEPVPEEITGEKTALILGAQANLWTEYISNPKEANYMTFPRLCALAEVVWSPKEKRDLDGFMERLPSHLERLTQMGVNFSKSFTTVRVLTGKMDNNSGFEVVLDCFFKPAVIRYTLDGSPPTFSSTEYTNYFILNETTTIKGAAGASEGAS